MTEAYGKEKSPQFEKNLIVLNVFHVLPVIIFITILRMRTTL